jgi:uncharacterized membrane protein
MVCILILQFWLCTDVTGFESVVLLYSSAAYNVTVFGTQLLFLIIGISSLAGFLLLLLLRRNWKSVHAEPAILVGTLFSLAAASAILIDPTPMTAMNEARFLVGVIIFSLAFPIGLIESASAYSLSIGRHLQPQGTEMGLWMIVSGFARVTGPLWSTYAYTIGEDPWVFFVFALVGSFLCFVLLILIWQWIVERQHLKRAIETSAILQQEEGHLIN